MRLKAINFILLALAVSVLACQSSEQKAVKFNKLFNDAYVLTQAGKHAESIPLYQRAIKTDNAEPRVADLYNNLGWARAQLGNHKAAIADYQAALKLRPDYPLAKNNLRVAQAELAKTKPQAPAPTQAQPKASAPAP